MGFSGIQLHLRNGTLLPRIRYGRKGWRVLGTGLGESTIGVAVHRLNKLRVCGFERQRYLEIGLNAGHTLERVEVPTKWGVDPDPAFRTSKLPSGVDLFIGYSDQFFEQIPTSLRFDLVYVDGLHEWRQTYRDILNSLNHGSADALILVDDVIPIDATSAVPDHSEFRKRRRLEGSADLNWHGDVFKAICAVAGYHPELEVRVFGSHRRGDNPQALVWRRDYSRQEYDIPASLQDYPPVHDLSYEDVFEKGGGRFPQLESEQKVLRDVNFVMDSRAG